MDFFAMESARFITSSPSQHTHALVVQQDNQTRSGRHLPGDLLTPILSRLPVKSLLRFRCVSQSWLSLVDDGHRFARLHLNTFKNNLNETHLLVYYHERDHYNYKELYDYVVHCTDTFEAIQKTSFTHLEYENGWYPRSSLDGLILLETHLPTFETFLMLWNPTLRKFRRVPPLPFQFRGPFFKEVLLGLGYDPLAKEYNIVKMILFRNQLKNPILMHAVLHSVAIYTVGTGSWKFIPFQVNVTPIFEWPWEFSVTQPVYLEGSFYFSVRGQDHTTFVDLVSFDLSTKMFSLVSMPDDLHRALWKDLVLINGESSLAFVTDDCSWVLERESMIWMKRSTNIFMDTRFLYGKKNGDTILASIKRDMSTQLVSFSPEKHECKIIQDRRSKSYYSVRVFAHIESLILP